MQAIPKPEAVYMIQEREFIQSETPVYKIGRTCQEPMKRFAQYPKGSSLLLHRACIDCREIETQIKTLFKKKYVQERAYGIEYFRGDAASMAADINLLVAAEAELAVEKKARAFVSARALCSARAAKIRAEERTRAEEQTRAEEVTHIYIDTSGSVPMDVVDEW